MDLDASERFYAGTLGLPVVDRWPDREAIWLMAGDRTRIGLWRPQVGVAGGRGGAHVHFALHLDERHFDTAVSALRSQGVKIAVESHRRGSRSAYMDDPDGNCVELWTMDVGQFARRSTAPAQLPEEAGSPAHFDATALRWDSSYDAATLRAHWMRARLEAVVRLLGDGPGALLEVGTGSGRLLAAMAARGWTVTGVDAAPRMIELARTRVPQDAGHLAVARAEALPFARGAFDGALAIGVLEYADMDAALGEMVRVLRPEGRAVVGLRRRRAPTAVWQDVVVFPVARFVKGLVPFGRAAPRRRRAALPPERARALLTAAGLSVERIEHVGCAVVPDPLDRLAPRLAYRAALRAEELPRLRDVFSTQTVILCRKR
jgi:SAM-dependent methyltransferase/catechol 2,3-dioxygenase-like lactoylglutathione lyase family enzyme